MTESAVSGGRAQLRADIKLRQFFTLALGSIVGVSWLVLLGEWLGLAGPLGAIIGFAAGTLLVMTVGLCYAEMATMLPVAGGEVVYAYEVFGLRSSFAIGWLLAMAYVAATSFEAVAVGWIAETIVPGIGGPVLYTVLGSPVTVGSLLVGVVGMATVTYLNYRGVRWAAAFQDVLIWVLLALAVVFIMAGIVRGDAANLAPLFPTGADADPVSGMLTVFLMSPVFLGGFNLIPQVMEEKAPSVAVGLVGKVILLSIGVAGAFYCLVIFSSSMTRPWIELLEIDLPVAGAFRVAFGSERLMRIVLFAALCGLITTWNARYMAASRLLFAMGRARIIPPVFGRVHPEHGTPAAAILFIGVIGASGAFVGRSAIVPLVSAVGAVAGFVYLVTTLGVLQLRRTQPDRGRPYRMPGGVAMAAVAALGSLLFLGTALYQPIARAGATFPLEWIIMGVWLALGALVWTAGRRGRDRLSDAERRRLMLGTASTDAEPGAVARAGVERTGP